MFVAKLPFLDMIIPLHVSKKSHQFFLEKKISWEKTDVFPYFLQVTGMTALTVLAVHILR